MELKNYFAQWAGAALPGAMCYLYQPDTDTLASGLKNAAGADLANPFSADDKGLIQFAAPNGAYDLRVMSGGRDYRVRVQCLDVSEQLQTAQSEADRATGEATRAATGATRAEAARDAAQASGSIFADVSAGLAATTSGDFFSVPSVDATDYLTLYLNSAGTAVEKKRYPSSYALTSIEARIPWVTASGVLFASVDARGNFTWLVTRESDGLPHDYAMQCIRSRLGEEHRLPDIRTIPGYMAAILDGNDNLTWLSARESDGMPPEFVIQHLAARIKPYVDSGSAASNADPLAFDKTRVFSVGSSSLDYMASFISAAIGGAYPATAFYNGAKGGEKAEHMLARLGARNALLTFPGNTIPASGSVVVTVSNVPASSSMRPYSCSINGVQGTLSSSATEFTWSRSTAGAEVACMPDTPAQPTALPTYRNSTAILNIGKNNLTAGDSADAVMQFTCQAYDFLSKYHRRVLVMTHFQNYGTSEASAQRARIRDVNNRIHSEFGDLAIPLDQYVSGIAFDGGTIWDHTGISPTSDDLAQQALMCLPSSLGADTAHLNSAGNAAVAEHLILAKLTAFNWLGE